MELMDPTIFGPAWTDLRLEHVQQFLSEADDEPLLWEAKGTEIDSHHVRKAVCGFANSHEGGYLILGAVRQGRAWQLDGCSFPDEAAVWIGQVIDTGITPRPGYDIKTFQTRDHRHLALVQVEPTPTPPCITHGTVYERIPGRTVPVKESARLAELFARGERAHQEAQESARWMRGELLRRGRDHPMYEQSAVQCVLSVATTGNRADVSSRLFSNAFRSTLVVVSSAHLGSGVPDQFVERTPTMEQDLHLLETNAPDGGGFSRGWLVAGRWDGSVGIYFVSGEGTTSQILCDHVYQPAWIAAVRLLRSLEGYGPAYAALAACGSGHQRNALPVATVLPAGWDPGTLIDRGPIAADESALDLRSIERELDRALGHDAFEPG
jgi:hypothetical protein